MVILRMIQFHLFCWTTRPTRGYIATFGLRPPAGQHVTTHKLAAPRVDNLGAAFFSFPPALRGP